MQKVADFIVNHKKVIIILYAVLLAIGFLLSLGVSVNYNLAEYLPDDAGSKKAIAILEQEYSNNGSASLFIRDTSITQALEIKNQVQNVEGVKSLVWLDDIYDLKQPLSHMDETIVDDYFKDGSALMLISFDYNDYSELTEQAIAEISGIIGDNGLIIGPAVSSSNLINSITSSALYGLLLALGIIIIILLISTTSYFEVVLFLVTIGISVLINNGTNIIFGEISFMTSSASAILQIAIAMDYSIFLLHRFTEEKKLTSDHKKAMSNAIRHSFSSISSSAVTTIVGFLALTFMSFRIGFDLGLVLAKGILISMICILTLLPVLALISKKPIAKTTHKRFLPSFKRMEKGIAKARYFIIGFVLLIGVLSFFGQSNNTFLFGTESAQETKDDKVRNEEVSDVFGSRNPIVLIVPNDDIISEAKMAQEIKQFEHINSISGMYALVDETIPISMIPQALKDEFVSENYSRYLIYLDTRVESESAFSTFKSLQATAAAYFDEYYMVGQTPSTYDIETASEKDFTVVNTISMVAVGIILLITFKSLLLPIILLFIIQISIWMNMAIPYYLGNDLLFIGYLIVASMQLGATIDYAILLTNRYKESRFRLSPRDSAIAASDLAGHSIFTSAAILGASGLIIGMVFDQPAMRIMGTLIGRGALISGAMVIFVLPQLLMVLDKAIGYTTLKWPGRQKRLKKGEHYED